MLIFIWTLLLMLNIYIYIKEANEPCRVYKNYVYKSKWSQAGFIGVCHVRTRGSNSKFSNDKRFLNNSQFSAVRKRDPALHMQDHNSNWQFIS
jgi:hypothetical protein